MTTYYVASALGKAIVSSGRRNAAGKEHHGPERDNLENGEDTAKAAKVRGTVPI